jgi:hypothetical protein
MTGWGKEIKGQKSEGLNKLQGAINGQILQKGNGVSPNVKKNYLQVLNH